MAHSSKDFLSTLFLSYKKHLVVTPLWVTYDKAGMNIMVPNIASCASETLEFLWRSVTLRWCEILTANSVEWGQNTTELCAGKLTDNRETTIAAIPTELHPIPRLALQPQR